MKISLTTLAGMIGAVALAVDQITALSPDAHLACKVAASAALALVGYHAQDRSNKRPGPPAATLAILAAALCIYLAGCKVGGLGVQVTSPAFGSVGISLDGGVIGHGKAPTNAPTPLSAPR